MTHDFHTNLQHQRDFFYSRQTLETDFRIKQLKLLREAILQHEEEICQALWLDLHKPRFESYVTEVGLVLKEISLHIRSLKRWSRPERASTNQLIHFWSSSRIRKEPFGVVLIIAPWNYPFMLVMSPLIGAISAGNCVALKPSEHTPNVAGVIEKLIAACFAEEYVSVYQGDAVISQALLSEKWDFIFFTGNPEIGRSVMKAASQHLTPVVLELGGKNPCIVDQDANLKRAAARIAWGKLVNAGQTCIAPDYLFVHKKIRTEFLELLKKYMQRYYGGNPKESVDYVRIATVAKTERLGEFLKGMEVFYGGDMNYAERYLAPTILTHVTPNDAIMQEEIFGPILPVLEFDSLDEVIGFVNEHPKPLACYYFSGNKQKQEVVLSRTSSGGACINDVIMQFVSDSMPFGGVGNSGMGSYHGKYSFETFTHRKPVLKKVTWIDVPLRYPPYKGKLGFVKWVFRIW